MGKRVNLVGVLSVIMAFLLFTPSFATEIGTGLDLDGQMRWRIEFDGKDFSDATAMNEFSLLRSRVALKVTSIEKAVVYFQIQDSRNLGLNSAGLTNDTNLGVHQGYIKLKKLFSDRLHLQLGRFEAPYGRHRLMGNVGWSNVGRSFDGVRLSRKGNTYKADIFCLKVVERGFQSPPEHKDHKLYGIYSQFFEDRFHLFVLYDWDLMKTGDDYDLARFTLGGMFGQKLESGISYVFDAALQAGNQGAYDISAYMVAGDIYYHMDANLSKVGFGFDVTSGDDDLTDDDIKWFNNLYYTGHKFRGFMDYFIASNTEGLMDLVFRATFKPCPMGSINIDVHHFQTMVDHLTPDGDSSKAIGQEIDVTMKRTIQENLGFQGGISTFLASEDWIADADPAYWVYFMLTAGF
jgi:hypothetical protein